MTAREYILTLSCEDARGIVASVAGFVASQEGFIHESTQYGDPSTGRFFMRVHFACGAATPAEEDWKRRFHAEVGERFGMDWALHDCARTPRLLVMVSKAGHCLNDLLHRHHSGTLGAEIAAVVSNHPDMERLVAWHNIPYFCLPASESKKAAQEARMLELVAQHNVQLVVLARYMQILSPELCRALEGRAINIHHSFLPGFKGARPYHQAHARGVKLIGATAHYVTEQLDEGPIIEQEVARVTHTHTPDDLAAIGRDIENRVLARAVKYHIERRVLLNGQKTVVFA